MLAASPSSLTALPSIRTNPSAVPPNRARVPAGASAVTVTWRVIGAAASGSAPAPATSRVRSSARTVAPTASSSRLPEVRPSSTVRSTSTGLSASTPLR